MAASASITGSSAPRAPESVLDEATRIAEDAIGRARVSLMAQLPFMDVALWRMPLAVRLQASAFETDGRILWFDAAHVIELYRKNPNEVLRGYFHAIMHCVFRHPFDDKHPAHALWDIACDASVEATAIELLGIGFPSERDGEEKRMLERIREKCPALTAQSIYRALAGNGESGQPAFSPAFAASLDSVFARDGHTAWPRASEREIAAKSVGDELSLMPSDGNDKLGGKADDPTNSEDKSRSPGANMPGMAAPSSSSNAVLGNVEDPDALVDAKSPEEAEAAFESMDGVTCSDFASMTWQDIGSQIDMDMEAFSGKIGFNAGTFQVNLAIANRKRYDYRTFLKRFSALSEEMKTSPDEFDYIYYTFGLSRYKNMPLVEPLEYQETNRIRDFVIAIDTSASCAGKLVRTFAEKTYDVLKNSEGFGRKVNIHVIQCDCDITRDVKITSIRDIDRAFEEFATRGFGGTDFRPVFKYVDELVRTRELANLKGLIYFTDGLGKYPASPPAYQTAFVFVDDVPRERKVPPWAMKAVMDEDDVYEL